MTTDSRRDTTREHVVQLPARTDTQPGERLRSLGMQPPRQLSRPPLSLIRFAFENRLPLLLGLHPRWLCRRRIDLQDLAQAIGLGVVRPGDERAAHLRAVPTGFDPKPKRLFGLHVARRKILHGGCFLVGVRPSNADRFSVDRRSRFLLSYCWRAGQSPRGWPRRGRDGGCRPG